MKVNVNVNVKVKVKRGRVSHTPTHIVQPISSCKCQIIGRASWDIQGSVGVEGDDYITPQR